MTQVGVMLPTFTPDPTLALEAARVAEDGGLAGVFAFDHLWPMGSPERPLLWSFAVLAAVAAVTTRVALGPLVARIDLLPEAELVRVFDSLAAIAGPERVIAALGAGDRLSTQENEAYGLARQPVADRLDLMARVADQVRSRGIQTWIGGTSDAVARLAAEHADFHNVWGISAEDVEARRSQPLTWGGQVLIGRTAAELGSLRDSYGDRPGLVAGTVAQIAEWVRALGVDWVVCAPLDYLAAPARATETVCLVAQAVQYP